LTGIKLVAKNLGKSLESNLMVFDEPFAIRTTQVKRFLKWIEWHPPKHLLSVNQRSCTKKEVAKKGEGRGFKSLQARFLKGECMGVLQIKEPEVSFHRYSERKKRNPCIKIPLKLGRTISKHIDAIFGEGYAHNLSKEDFFHGHFLFDKKGMLADPAWFGDDGKFKERVFSLREYFSAASAVIYHTREYLGDWKPGRKNKPRSIVGTMDGDIHIPIYKSKDYRLYGSIGGEQPFMLNGKLNPYKQEIPLVKIGEKVYRSESVVFIKPAETGRFKLKSGQRYELYLLLKTEKSLKDRTLIYSKTKK